MFNIVVSLYFVFLNSHFLYLKVIYETYVFHKCNSALHNLSSILCFQLLECLILDVIVGSGSLQLPLANGD
jgi:hypothetical protein